MKATQKVNRAINRIRRRKLDSTNTRK